MLVSLGAGGLSPGQRIVLAALAYHDGPGGARPTAERIASLAGMSRSGVFVALAALERAGWIRRRQWRGASRYTVAYGEPFDPDTVPDGRTVSPPVETVPDGGTVSAPIPSRTLDPYRPGLQDPNQKEQGTIPESPGKAACGLGSECGFVLKPEAERCALCGIDDGDDWGGL